MLENSTGIANRTIVEKIGPSNMFTSVCFCLYISNCSLYIFSLNVPFYCTHFFPDASTASLLL